MPTFNLRKYGNSIYVVYRHQNDRFRIFTGAKTDDKYWNNTVLKKNCPNYKNLQKLIDDTLLRVMEASRKIRSIGNEPSAELVRQEFHRNLAPTTKKQSFRLLYKNYTELLQCKPITKTRVAMTGRVLEYFSSFAGYTINTDTFNKIMFGRFVQYLHREQHMADSTINRHCKRLKSFLYYINPDRNWNFVKYNMLHVQEHVIALTENELKILIDAELSGYLETTRDLFVFLATTGMRYSDGMQFDPSWITPDNVLEFTQVKTGGIAYPPLFEITKKILAKYNGMPPHYCQQRFNKQLKELFVALKLDRPIVKQVVRERQVFRETKPLSTVISSHTARRTFISLCLQKGMPLQDVMRMSGHSDYKSMKPYIDISRKHIRAVADKWII